MDYNFEKTTTKIIEGGSGLLKGARDQLSEVFKDFDLEGLSTKVAEKVKPYKITATKTETVIEFNLAGYAKEEVKVQIDERKGTLKVSATHVDGETTNSVTRTFSLSNGVKASAITSKYRHGLLVITIQKPDMSGEQDIPID